MSNVLEIEFLCGAHSSGERQAEHSSTPAMVQQSGADVLLEPGELGCSSTAALWVSTTFWGGGIGQSTACALSDSCLGRCRPITEVKQDLCTDKPYDT